MTVVPSAPVLKDSDHRDTPMFRILAERRGWWTDGLLRRYIRIR